MRALLPFEDVTELNSAAEVETAEVTAGLTVTGVLNPVVLKTEVTTGAAGLVTFEVGAATVTGAEEVATLELTLFATLLESDACAG